VKFKLIIDPESEEQVIVYAHRESELTDTIKDLISKDEFELNGYTETDIVRLNLQDIICFTVIDNKVYAITVTDTLQIKNRLYKIEEKLPHNFIKINQSCIANIKQIKKFHADFAGTLQVIFKNGYKDYVSRRNLKKVKERLGL